MLAQYALAAHIAQGSTLVYMVHFSRYSGGKLVSVAKQMDWMHFRHTYAKKEENYNFENLHATWTNSLSAW